MKPGGSGFDSSMGKVFDDEAQLQAMLRCFACTCITGLSSTACPRATAQSDFYDIAEQGL
jgi:hypothetical protein